MNTKVAVGLIVLTAAVTYGVSHPRRHHFEQTKFDGILVDTETGVQCSARLGLKRSDENKKSVWAAGLAAKKAESEYHALVDLSSSYPNPLSEFGGTPAVYPNMYCGYVLEDVRNKCNNLFSAMQDADSTYNALVEKADNEKVPDPNSSYFKNFPLCKDVR